MLKKYRQSDEYKIKLKEYFQSDKGKEARKKDKKYREGEKYQKYIKSDVFKEKINKWAKAKRKSDPVFKLSHNLRSRISIILNKKKLVKKSKLLEVLGCTLPELKDHIQKQFISGMTWENHTLHGWHVDHIIPLVSAKTVEEVERLCHYTNLQPLWATENWKKGDKII